MLLKEAIVWHQLRHEYILPFYGLVDTPSDPNDSLVLVSPWMNLGDLHDFSSLENNRIFSGPDFVRLTALSFIEVLYSSYSHR